MFEALANSRWFTESNTIIILVMTKIDVFERKLSRVSINAHGCWPGQDLVAHVSQFLLSDVFPEYEEGADVTAAVRFVLNRFLSLASDSLRPRIYSQYAALSASSR
jgi:hypothetical protein